MARLSIDSTGGHSKCNFQRAVSRSNAHSIMSHVIEQDKNKTDTQKAVKDKDFDGVATQDAGTSPAESQEAEAAKEARFQVVENSQKLGQTFEETMVFYKEWVKTYREDLEVVGYQAPALASQYLAGLNLPKDIKILDLPCGTGWGAFILRDQYGYKDFDGLDASEEMLAEAKKADIYGKLYHKKIGDGHLVPEIEDDTYDAITFAGGIVEGHIKLDAYEEMIRFVKRGGYIVTAMREENRRKVDDYKHMNEYLRQLEERGLWVKVAEYVTPKYYMDLEGLTLVHRVTKRK